MTENTMKRKLGIFIWFGYRLPVQERIHLIREVALETVLHWWDDSFIDVDGLSKEEQADAIRNAGLGIENAHLQDKYINDLRMDSVDGQAAFDKYLSDIDGLAQSEIPVAVMHVTSGPTPPPLSAIGMKRMQSIVEGNTHLKKSLHFADKFAINLDFSFLNTIHHRTFTDLDSLN